MVMLRFGARLNGRTVGQRKVGRFGGRARHGEKVLALS